MQLGTSTTSIFFSGVFRLNYSGADRDARIGYCASKKLAYIGYKCHLACSSEDETVLDFIVTPANIHDSKLFIPLFSSMLSSGIFNSTKEVYGDNAYDSEQNRNFLIEKGIKVLFHTKEETGKEPKKKRSARKKSKIRSRIEVIFGISNENLGFGTVKVRGLFKVMIDTSLVFSAWNFGILMSYYINQFADRISLKKLLYKN